MESHSTFGVCAPVSRHPDAKAWHGIVYSGIQVPSIQVREGPYRCALEGIVQKMAWRSGRVSSCQPPPKGVFAIGWLFGYGVQTSERVECVLRTSEGPRGRTSSLWAIDRPSVFREVVSRPETPDPTGNGRSAEELNVLCPNHGYAFIGTVRQGSAMHKGKPYPYLYQFWATECQFWPGYVPWKTKVFFPGLIRAPWDLVDPDGIPISEPGGVVTDCTQAFWEINLGITSVATKIKISIEMEQFSTTKYAVYQADLFQDATLLDTIWFFRSFPSRSFGVGNANWWHDHDPSSPSYDTTLAIQGATYAEGGSPWS